jgi:hypothetical protein
MLCLVNKYHHSFFLLMIFFCIKQFSDSYTSNPLEFTFVVQKNMIK